MPLHRGDETRCNDHTQLEKALHTNGLALSRFMQSLEGEHAVDGPVAGSRKLLAAPAVTTV